jgi:(p)ppGpp synthase/HD superfamily hydrolase
MSDVDLVGRALAVASKAHAGQRRPDGSPYMGHPLRVCELLARAGFDDATLAAALLHDAVEDSELSVGDVVEGFGLGVGELVAALTEDERIDDWVARKDALREQVAEAGRRGAAIYAADKLANLHDLSELYDERGEEAIELHKAPTLDLRVAAWRADVEMIARVAPRLELLAALREQLEAFERRRMKGIVSGQEATARG